MTIRIGFSFSCALCIALISTACGALPAARGKAEGSSEARPVLLTTDEMLELARSRVKEGKEPFLTSWRKTLQRADQALREDLDPYQGTDYTRYFRTARAQSQAARDLALAFHVTGNSRYAERARGILLAWAEEFEKTSNFPDSYPASDVPHGAGLVIGRTVVVFGDAYALLYAELSEPDREKISHWFRGVVPPMKEELRIWKHEAVKSFKPPYLDRQFFNNHLSGCTLGIAAVGFALQDRELIDYAYGTGEEERSDGADVEHRNPRDVPTLIEGAILMPGDFGSGEEGDVWQGPPGDPSLRGAPPPAPGEIWDRYRVIQGHGVPYAILHLRLLTLMAELAHNNLGAPFYDGPDFFKFTGSRGENLEVSFSLYADWFITMDMASVNDGYYVNSMPEDTPERSPGDFMHGHALYELVSRHYPENPRIREALRAREEAGDRPAHDHETFGWTAALLYGPDLE